MFVRVAGLVVIELFLAVFDFVRGVASGREFWQELVMIPARVLVVVLLRELVTVGTCYDVARGVPVIWLNLLGYDEQAHRRGPESRFAHWTLKSIDRCVHRIWRAIHDGAGRDYDLWILSDHGQETTTPWQTTHDLPIQELVATMVDEAVPAPRKKVKLKKSDRIPTRANWLGIGWLVTLLFGEQDHDIQTRSPNVQTVTSGSIGFVYLLTPHGKIRGDEFARRLVAEHGVPMTVRAEGDEARVFTPEGEFVLPRDAVQVFGPDHPFTEDVTSDLIALARHRDAGDIVLLGWTRGQPSTSFVLQHGAHAGPGLDETHGFALMPCDVRLPDTGKSWLRPDDLRKAALHFLGRDTAVCPARPRAVAADCPLRLMTYNVHACVGMDGRLSPERIARVIGQSDADVVCLQELDAFRLRSGKLDQAQSIARILEMDYHFHPAWHVQDEQFGNAVLTRHPMRVIERGGLHHHKADRSRRSAIWVEIDAGGSRTIQVINTHMSIYPVEQRIQARELLEKWVAPARSRGPVILCGDFNARPGSRTWSILAASMRDVESFDERPARRTYFSPWPLMRVDHIFVTGTIRADAVHVLDSRMARTASDHLPLVADLRFDKTADVPAAVEIGSPRSAVTQQADPA
jgi:endonuclease/exonuclease/phosphatase family metal-dependent hydrolase